MPISADRWLETQLNETTLEPGKVLHRGSGINYGVSAVERMMCNCHKRSPQTNGDEEKVMVLFFNLNTNTVFFFFRDVL